MSVWQNSSDVLLYTLRKTGIGPGFCGSMIYVLFVSLLKFNLHLDYFLWLFLAASIYYHFAFYKSRYKKQFRSLSRRDGHPFGFLLLMLLFVMLLLLSISILPRLLSDHLFLFLSTGLFFLLSYPFIRNIAFLKNAWIASCWWLFTVFFPSQNIWGTADAFLILTGFEIWLLLFILSLLADIPDIREDTLSQSKTWATQTPYSVSSRFMIMLWIADSLLLIILWYFTVIPFGFIVLNALSIWLFKKWQPEKISYPLFDFMIVFRFILLIPALCEPL